MNFHRLLLPVSALVVFTARPLSAADAIEFKQRWNVGKQYFLTAQTAQRSTIEMGPQKMEQTNAMTMEMSMAVRRHEDGKRKRMTLKYDRVAMEMSMNGQKMGFDSAKPGEGSDPLGLSKSLGVMVGKELKVLINENDEISEIENYDEFVKQLAPSPLPGMDPTKMFSRESLTQMMKQGALQAIPGHAVAPGESWPFANELVMAQFGKVTVRGTYTFKGMTQHDGAASAEILTDATLAMELGETAGTDASAQGKTLAQLGMKVSNGTLKGTVWFDPQLGMARDSDLVQEMTVTMKNPTDPTATLSVPMKQNIKTTLTKVEDLK